MLKVHYLHERHYRKQTLTLTSHRAPRATPESSPPTVLWITCAAPWLYRKKENRYLYISNIFAIGLINNIIGSIFLSPKQLQQHGVLKPSLSFELISIQPSKGDRKFEVTTLTSVFLCTHKLAVDVILHIFLVCALQIKTRHRPCPSHHIWAAC